MTLQAENENKDSIPICYTNKTTKREPATRAGSSLPLYAIVHTPSRLAGAGSIIYMGAD